MGERQDKIREMSRGGSFGSSAPIRKASQLEAPPAKKKVGRTSAGLRDALFDAIEMVKAGDMTAGDAQAIALLSGSICKTVQLEIEVAKLRTEYPADTKLVMPSALTLGEDKNE